MLFGRVSLRRYTVEGHDDAKRVTFEQDNMKKITDLNNMATIFYLLLFSLAGSVAAGGILMLAETFIPTFESGIWNYRLSLILQDILVMFLPAYFLFKRTTHKPLSMLGLRMSNGLPLKMIYGLLVFFVSYPAISVVTQWNEQIILPDSLSAVENWMRQMENAAKQVTDLLLSGETGIDLFLNLLIIAAGAAFAEEVFFRGALQQFLEKWLGNGHVAVWVGAFIFSVIHLQFYGFFPRLIMGAVLGYLFLYSRNLWVPILYHLVNNASVILVSFFWGEPDFLKQMEDESPTWLSALAVTASILLTLYVFSRYKKQLKEDDSN